VPFQFSLHCQQPDGRLSHGGFLDLDAGDPRRACAAEALVAQIDTEGAIVCYNAGFEQGVIERLVQQFPDLEAS